MRRVTSFLLLMLMLTFTWVVNAQVSLYTFQSSSGTYMPITGGTVHLTGTWDDTQVSNVALGFNFMFNGVEYSTVSINPNGYLIIGGGTATMSYTPISNTTVVPGSVSAVGRDLQGITGTGEVRSELTGTAGNYVFVVQWTDAKRYGTSYPDENLDFQIKLYENGGIAELVYGPITGSAYTSPVHPQVGLRGATNADYTNRTTTADWAATTAGTINTATCTLTNLVYPADGLTFTFTPPDPNTPLPPTDPIPANAAVEVPVDGSLSWTFGTNSVTYDLMFGPAGNMTEVVTGATAGATGTYDYMGLTNSDLYQWRVIEHNGELVTYGPVWNFYTECAPFSIPFAENFDGVTTPALPICWSKIVGNTTNTYVNVETTTLYPNSAPYCAKMYNSGADTANLFLISPMIADPLAGNRVTFFARGGVNYSLLVGTMSDPADPATFTQVGEVFPPGAQTPFQVSFADYTGTDSYIAFKHGNMGTTQTIYIDDVVVEVLPDCIEPTLLTVASITNSSAALGWTSQGEETMWDVAYGDPGFDPDTEGTIVPASSNPFTLGELASATPYEFYVRADCGTDAVSMWAGPKGFTTACDVFELPYMEDFTGGVAGTFPACWSQSGLATTNWSLNATANALGVAPELRFNYSPSFTGEAFMVSPMINTTGETTVAISFKHFFDYYAVPFTFGMKTTSDGINWNTVWEVIDPTANIGPEALNIVVDNTDVGSATFQFAFWVSGYTFNMDNWYIDDISVSVPSFGNLDGYVTEATRGVISNAHVFAGDYEAYTDETGYYLIEGIFPGTYDLTCEAEGYFPVTVEGFEVVANQTTTQDFELGYAQIVVNPTSLLETLPPDGISTQTLTISNPGGTEPLNWNASIELLEEAPLANFVPVTFGDPIALDNGNSANDICSSTAVMKGDLTDATWDVLQSFSTAAAGEQAVGTDGQFIYTTFWQGAGVFGKYQMDGTWIENFTIATAAGIRDFAYDGQYFYGGASGSTLFILDFQTQTQVGTIALQGGATCRHIAYDPTIDGFWVGNWTTLFQVDKTGAVLQTGPALVSVYGSAYDGVTAGGPFLWLFAQVGTNGCGDPVNDLVTLQQFDIATMSFTGVIHCATDIPGYVPGNATDQTIAGGAFATDLFMPGKFVLMVNVQQSPNLVGVYELANLATWLTMDTYSGVVNPGESQDITVTFDATGLLDTNYYANININHNGQELSDGMVTVPVELIVASAAAPLPPTDPMPEDGAVGVAFQPEFSWTNGAGTAQVRYQLIKETFPFPSVIYTSPWFIGNTLNLADVPKTLLPKTNYSWRISNRNAAGTVQGPKWYFTTIGVGTIGGVVTDNYTGLPLEGVSVYTDDMVYSATTAPDGTYSIGNVIEGVYNLNAELDGYVSQMQEVTVVHGQPTVANFALDEYLEPPFGLQAEVDGFVNVNLTWNAPGGAWTPEWLTYSGETIANSIGAGAANFDVAARFTPDQLTEFPGGSVTKIQFVPGEPDLNSTYTLKVWQGVSPPTLIYEQLLPTVTADVWNEVVLDSPVPFDNTEELWFGFNCNATTGFPAGCDAGPQVEGFSNMIYWSGAWTTLTALNSALTYNWAVKGYVELAKGAVVLDPIKGVTVVHNNAGTLDSRPEKIQPAAISYTPNSTRSLTGYNVYRNEEFLVNTVEPLYSDLALEAGDYFYTVTAVYDEGESDAIGPKGVSILAPPTLLSAEGDYYGVQLQWMEGSDVPLDARISAKQLTSGVKPVLKKERNTATVNPNIYLTRDGKAVGDSCENPATAVLGTNSAPGSPYWYEFSVAQDAAVTISSCVDLQEVDTDLKVYDACDGALIAANDDLMSACGAYIYASAVTFNALAGTSYKILWDDTWSTDPFEFTIVEDEICTVECPGGSLTEPELCGEDLNGGCNAEIPAYSPIAIGDVICGTAFAHDGSRDTDWYELVLDAPKTISWTVTAEFPLLLFILDGTNGCDSYGVVQSASTGNCETATATATVPPGTYWLWVGNQGFYGNPCGEYNDYVAELTAEDAFLSYFNVFRDGEDIADAYGMSYYDTDVTNGENYCYTVSQVLDPAFETAVSNELCADVPLIPVAEVSPLALTESHAVPPAQITTQTVTITNTGEGVLDWSLMVSLEPLTDGSKAYCDASTVNEDETIGNVLCGDIDNTSDWQGGVADYTAISTSIFAGGSEDIVVTNTGNPYTGDLVTCWVDWSNDEVFDVGTDEEFILTNVGGAGITFAGTISVPEGTAEGAYRMRVRMTWSTAPAPCGAANYGEVEDYTIMVQEPSPDWMFTDIQSGSIAAGESQDIAVSFNSNGLEEGMYSGGLEIMTNDPMNPMVMVYADFEVTIATGMLSGYVSDAFAKGPVQGVTILAEEIRYSATTDENGYYEMVLPIGNYAVTASKDGYAPQTVEPVVIVLDQMTQQDFMLEFGSPVLLYANGGVGEISLGWTGNQVFRGGSTGVSTSNKLGNIERLHGDTHKLPNSSGRATGDDCTDPIVVGALPYTDVNSTCGRGDYTDTTCLGSYDGGEDIFYMFTLTEEKILTITMTTTTTWTGMLLTDECPPSATCIATATNSGAGGVQITDTLVAGTYYIMIDTWPTPDCIPDFTLTIEEYQECVVECPVGALDEGEPCGDDTNGGCNALEFAVMPLMNGDVVCGNAWADAGSRDTDWYEIVLDEPSVVTWTVTAEFPVYAFIIEGNFGCEGSYIMGEIGAALPCGTAVATATVPPGTYWLWVGNQSFYDNPCGSSNNYVAEVTWESTFLSYFNVQRDGETIAQTYYDTYIDTDIMPDTEYCYSVNQVIIPGVNSAESNELCATMLCATGCDYILNFYDDYGDGWNGASIEILQDGNSVGSYTLAGGTFGSQTIMLCDASVTSLVWTSGSFDYECGFELFDAAGTLITSFDIGSAPLAGEFFTFTTECPVAPEQMVQLDMNWNAWSSYIAPSAKMGMEELMAPVVDNMIITKYFTELYYPAFGINNMGEFSNNHGYLTKMSAEATLPIMGMMADPTVYLTEGWNLMSVLQDCPIPAVDVFSTLPGLVIAYEPVGNGIYYPAGNLFTLVDLNPGMAYWVKVDADVSYTYPGCIVTKGSGSSSHRAVNNTNWNDVNYTGINHAVVFDANAVVSLKAGDMIGAFTTNGWCAGLVEYSGENLGFNLFGDDITTDMADGFTESENISFRLFRPATEEEFDIEVTYSFEAPNADGLFAINGLSVVTDLKLSPTSIGVNLLNGLSIYPNPSSGIFNIALNNIDEDINFVVLNAQGQEVYSGSLLDSQQLDLSAEPKGVYFIKFMNNGILGIEKLVIK